MRQMFILLKINCKLLFRNKGFWFFLLFMPLLALLLLNIREQELNQFGKNKGIIELNNIDAKAIYATQLNSSDKSYIVKVYDSSQTKVSEEILEELFQTGMVNICRIKTKEYEEKEILQKIKENGENDRAGTILYFKKDFKEKFLSGKPENGIKLYQCFTDERTELMENSLNNIISRLYIRHNIKESLNYTEQEKNNQNGFIKPKKKTILIESADSQNLTSVQERYKEHFGYSLAIASLGFLFCGIFIAYTIIEEQENQVYTRILLTPANIFSYILSKLGMAILLSIVQVGILAVGICFLVRPEFGISRISYLFLTFLLGLIFNMLSLCVGVLCGNIMAANYSVFCIWSISCLLAGLYFSLNSASGLLKTLSYLMPQKWILKSVEQIMLGNHSGYFTAIVATLAYLMVILSVGAVGLRMKKEE